MMKKKVKDKSYGTEEDSVQTPTECLSFDNYQCTGNVEVDFPKLCSLMDIMAIPPVYSKMPERNELRITTRWPKPYVQVVLENKCVLSCKGLKIMGWRVNEAILQVLNKLIQNLNGIQSLSFWNARLTDERVMSLSNTLSLGGSLRVVYLEKNRLPNLSYHLLLSEDSVITKLFLRNNQIGDEGARLIGSALSTTKKANKNLLFLNLAFNCIGDAGAMYLAQGLRFNRALIYLSLTNNQIGDSGAASLSKILSEFPLSHEEVVERRKMLAEKMEPNLSPEPGELTSETNSPAKPEPKTNTKKKDQAKKEEKPEKASAKKENPKKSAQKQPKSPPPPSKGGKPPGKKKPAPVDQTEVESSIVLAEPEVEIVNPLLDFLVYCNEGQWFYPGNSTLVYLSLAGNTITEKSLPLFLSSLEQQTHGGLSRLHLNRNHFSPDCELAKKIDQLLLLKIQNNQPVTEVAEEEHK